MDIPELQKRAYQNKLAHGFNVKDIPLEFMLMETEVAEAFIAWLKKKDNAHEELADIAIYLLGLCEILGVDLKSEILRKMDINEKRVYREKDGVLQRVDAPEE